MLSLLKDHPFAVETFFESSLVITYAVAKEELTPLIANCLELETFDDTWGFIAVALVKAKKLRPKGFPEFMGTDFLLTGYRIFVRYITREGKRLRGLYILRSETDKAKMVLLGNIFTHYNYKKTDINFTKENAIIKVRSLKSDLNIEVLLSQDEVPLPKSSPFTNWKEARRFAGPLPFTFTYTPTSGEVLLIEGVRENWTPKPVEVIQSHVGFINQLSLKKIALANAFIITDIPYYWKKGKKEIWKP